MKDTIGKLYVIPTPIGNLEDITLRAKRLLQEVDYLLAEDTRTTGKLLSHLSIDQTLRSYHLHNEHKIVQQVVSVFGLSFNTNIELAYRDKLDKANPLIYEINPRISAPIAMHKYAGINLLLLGILLCLGKSIPTNLKYNEIYMQRCWQEVYS